jgi:GNAT superfamily N-acetyltransferase
VNEAQPVPVEHQIGLSGAFVLSDDSPYTASRRASCLGAKLMQSYAGIRIRDFEPADYPRMGAIVAAIEPERGHTPDWYRERDERWNPELLSHRLVAEVDDRLVVGWGEVGHQWWSFHPTKFGMRLNVDPPFQHRGAGSALYTRLMQLAECEWHAEVIRCQTREDRPQSVSFLEHRGFQQRNRQWEARLQLDRARMDRFADAQQRLTEQGFVVVSIAEAHQQRCEQLARDLFELEQRATRAEPGYDPDGAMQFDQFVANELDEASLVEDGSFLALDGQRLIGVSRLQRDLTQPLHLHVGFTGTDPEYGGRGIAMALKLRTLDYARAHGFAEIRTQNDAVNVGMLHINDELGFEHEPAWLIYERLVSRGS